MEKLEIKGWRSGAQDFDVTPEGASMTSSASKHFQTGAGFLFNVQMVFVFNQISF